MKKGLNPLKCPLWICTGSVPNHDFITCQRVEQRHN